MAKRSEARRVDERNLAAEHLREAQRVVDLAAGDGFFEKCYANTLNKRGRKNTKTRMRVAAEELLADAYPDIRITIVEQTTTRREVQTIDERHHLVSYTSYPSVPRYRVVLEIKRRFAERMSAGR